MPIGTDATGVQKVDFPHSATLIFDALGNNGLMRNIEAFPEGLEAIAASATAVIQPGGSVKDQEVIAAADKLGMAMVLTGIRHFRH